MNPRRSEKFSADKFSMQALQALRAKYTRDYIPYFRALSEIYAPGSPRELEIKETLVLIERARVLLGEVISSGQVNEDSAKRIRSLARKIQSKKNYFAREAKKVEALQQSLQEVTQATGISLRELNATRDFVQQGIQLAQQAALEPEEEAEGFSAAFAKRALRSAARTAGRVLPSIGAVALGPFYPAVRKIAEEEMRERRALGVRRRGVAPARIRRPVGEEVAPVVPRIPARAKLTVEEEAKSLIWFFEVGAYRTKWTRELLAAVKGERVEGGMGLDWTKLGVVAAAGFAAVELARLAETTKEYWQTLKNVREEEEKYRKLTEKFEQKEKDVYGERARTAATPEERRANIEKLLESGKRTEERLKRESEHISDLDIFEFLNPFTGGGKLGDWWRGGIRGIDSDIQNLFKGSSIVPPTIPPSSPTISPTEPDKTVEKVITLMREKPTLMPSFEQPLENLNKSIENLTEQVRESRSEGEKLPAPGNLFDSGDILIQELAAGHLTLGD